MFSAFKKTALYILCFSTALTSLAYADASLTAGPADSIYQGISDDGNTIVGEINESSGTNRVSAKWVNGVLTTLDNSNSDSFQSIQGISGDGSVIVGIGFFGGHNTYMTPVYWKNGDFHTLSFLSGSSQAFTYGVSKDGNTIVGSSTLAGFETATRWANGVVTNLGTLSGDDTSRAVAANNNGSIIAGFSYLSSGSYNPSAVTWTNGVIQALPNAAGYTVGSTASVISKDGSVVAGVGYNNGPFYQESRAVSWTNGVVKLLDELPGGANLDEVKAISANGSIIVGMHTRQALFKAPFTGIILMAV